jgi:hypothetical protein
MEALVQPTVALIPMHEGWAGVTGGALRPLADLTIAAPEPAPSSSKARPEWIPKLGLRK